MGIPHILEGYSLVVVVTLVVLDGNPANVLLAGKQKKSSWHNAGAFIISQLVVDGTPTDIIPGTIQAEMGAASVPHRTSVLSPHLPQSSYLKTH